MIAGLALAMLITVYVPLAGGINGGPVASNGVTLRTGHAACGPAWRAGTVFEIENADMLPDLVVCIDRGPAVGNDDLDVALVSPDVAGDLRRAFGWGRRRRQVTVWSSMAHWRRARSEREKLR